MSNKVFDALRTLGWLVPMLAVFYAVCADALALHGADVVEKIAAGFAVLCNGIIEKARHDYAADEYDKPEGEK